MATTRSGRARTRPAWDPAPLAAQVGAGSAALLAAAVIVGILAPAQAAAAGPVLLVAAGLLGLPHGAVDHLALGWARGRDGPARPAVLGVYATAAAAAAVAALAFPRPALLVLLALSAAHFAEGEAAFHRLRGAAPGHRRPGPHLALACAAAGVVVVAGPLELRPAAVRDLVVQLDPGLPAALAVLRGPVLVGGGALVLAGLVAALVAGERRAAGELVLVTAAVLLAPPLLVFAVWFAGWHAPRHLVRLLALEPTGSGRERVRRLARGAAAPTLVAAGGLVALAVALGGLPGAVLVVLLALTVPHAAVVAWLARLRPAAVRTAGGVAVADPDTTYAAMLFDRAPAGDQRRDVSPSERPAHGDV